MANIIAFHIPHKRRYERQGNGNVGSVCRGVEVYSIDEAFLNLTGYESVYSNWEVFAQQIRSIIGQWTRIPVSIGIAPTKTLCKVANYYAKRQPEHDGVLLLDTTQKIADALQDFDVSDLWGIGWRYAGMRNGIRTAAQFRDLPAIQRGGMIFLWPIKLKTRYE